MRGIPSESEFSRHWRGVGGIKRVYVNEKRGSYVLEL